MPAPLFPTWSRYVLWFLAGLVACLMVNGVIRATTYPYHDYSLGGLSTYRPVPDVFQNPYESLYRWDAIYTGDYRPIHDAAKAWSEHGRAAKMYNPKELKNNSAAFVYTPFTALLVLPISGPGWDLQQSANVISWVNHALWIITAVLLLAVICHGRRPTVGIVVAFAAHWLLFYPVAVALQLTQASIWIMFFLALTAFLLQRGYDVLAGFAFAWAICFKPHLVLVPAMLFWVPRFPRRPLVVCGVTFCTMMLISLFWAGMQNWKEYAFDTLPILSRGYAYYPNQSLNGLLFRVFGPNDPAVFDLPKKVGWIKALSTTFLFGSMVYAWRLLRERPEDSGWDRHALVFAAATLTCVVASPVCWDHHMTALAVGFAIAVNWLWRSPGLRTRWVEAALLGAFLLNALYFETRGLWGAEAIFSAFGFYGALALVVVLYYFAKRPADASPVAA